MGTGPVGVGRGLIHYFGPKRDSGLGGNISMSPGELEGQKARASATACPHQPHLLQGPPGIPKHLRTALQRQLRHGQSTIPAVIPCLLNGLHHPTLP